MEMKPTFDKLNYPLIINIVLALTILVNLVMVPVFVTLDYDISGVESNVVFTLQSILKNNSTLYDNPEEVPFPITQYSPLYYMIADGIVTMSGAEPESDLTIRIIGRSISVGICLVLFIFLFRIIKKQIECTGKQAFTLAITMLAFAVPWYYLTRPDVLVGLFYLLFIGAAYRYIEKIGFVPAFLMGAMAIMAFVSKQNGLFITGAGGLFFLYHKDFKGMLYAFIGFAVAGGLFILVYTSLGYEAYYLLDNTFDGVKQGISIRSLIEKTILAFLSTFGFFAIGSVLIIYEFVKQAGKMDKKVFFTVWFTIFLFVFATLTAAKRGSSVNYYNEVLLGCLLLWGFYFQKLKASGFSLAAVQRAVLFVALAGFFASSYHMKQYFFTNLKELMSENQNLEQVAGVLKEEIGEDYFYSTIRQLNIKFPENTTFPQFDNVECCAYPMGIYSYTEWCKLIDAGKVKFLIFESQPATEIYGCKVENIYSPYQEVGPYRIYKYKNPNGQLTRSSIP